MSCSVFSEMASPAINNGALVFIAGSSDVPVESGCDFFEYWWTEVLNGTRSMKGAYDYYISQHPMMINYFGFAGDQNAYFPGSNYLLKQENKSIRVKTETNENSFCNKVFGNYPNPFNPSTKIMYSLAKDGFVVLKIYNVLGKEIKTLINDWQTKGNHEVIFNSRGLTSGIYYYKFHTTDYMEVKRMQLLK